MKIKRATTPSADVPASELDLQQLKRLLKTRGDALPKYMFRTVEQTTDIRDYRYVFWLDLMGARNLMKLSLPRAARSVMKIHAAALFAKQKHPKLEINPVMD